MIKIQKREKNSTTDELVSSFKPVDLIESKIIGEILKKISCCY